MDFKLSEELLALQNMVRDFAKKEIIPNIDKWEEKGEAPIALWRKMGELGLFGCPFPEEYGGTGMGVLAQVIVIEEIISKWIGGGGCFNQLTMSTPMGIYLWGTEEQKQKYLPKILKAEMIGCFGLTEPGVGSDAASLTTRAVRQGDYYIVNGAKMWITLGNIADIGVFFVKTDPAGGHRGISALLIPLDLPGITIRKIPTYIGTNCVPTTEIVFEDVKVPVENRLSNEGDGFKIAMSELEFGRVSVAARCVGVARGAYETALEYANQREAFGKPIGEYQMIKHLIADMATEIEAARMLVYRSAWLADNGERFNLESAMAKYFAADVCKRASHAGVEIHGAYGVSQEYKAGRYEQFANMMRTGEGPANIQRLLIAEDALGYKDANRHPRKFPENN